MALTISQPLYTLAKTDKGILIAAYSQASADKIKQSLSLRNEPVKAITHDALAKLTEYPSLLILDLNGVKTVAPFQQYVEAIPTMVLAPTFQENLFLTLHDWGALDFLVHPVAESYLVSKILDALKQNQLHQQMQRCENFLTELGVISARSGTLTTPHLLNALKKSVDEHYINPDVPISLILVQWSGMPVPCQAKLQTSIYQDIAGHLQDVARGNDCIGEMLEEKFVIIMPNTDSDGANALQSRLSDKLKEVAFTQKVKLTFSLGSAPYQEGQHYEQWLRQAFEKLTPISS